MAKGGEAGAQSGEVWQYKGYEAAAGNPMLTCKEQS